MLTERRIVTNRVFLLGLDEMYREAMKGHERGELLACARETAAVLGVPPADVPIEGYYAEEDALTEYFRLMRALQGVSRERESALGSSAAFERLKQVTESGLFGPPVSGTFLLPRGVDPLTLAIERTAPEWRIDRIVETAYHCAAESEDFSLVAMAALSRDEVTIAALRETVVLYAMAAAMAARFRPVPRYEWAVDTEIAKRASQFVAVFDDLFGESLPEPVASNAELFWGACTFSRVMGRCVRIGFDDGASPTRHYHWAIDYDADYSPVVKDFWDTDIWTTQRYRKKAGL